MVSDKERTLLSQEQGIYFRDQLRAARAVALHDAEEFHEILYALEQLGRYLFRHKIIDWKPKRKNQRLPLQSLGTFKEDIALVADRSPLAETIPKCWPEWHMPFSKLYTLVREARNDAMHQGVFARYVTGHAVALAIIVEDSLMSEHSEGHFDTVADFMVRGPICAQSWHPVSFIRQIMLENAFSYLPVWIEDESRKGWYLISDQAVASYLRAGSQDERTIRLATSLKDARGLTLESTIPILPNTHIRAALQSSKGLPLLIARNDPIPRPDSLLGILTPFDLL